MKKLAYIFLFISLLCNSQDKDSDLLSNTKPTGIDLITTKPVPDFSLYDIDKNNLTLSKEIGKPVLLIAMSYNPKSITMASFFDSLAVKYSNVKFIVIFLEEPHYIPKGSAISYSVTFPQAYKQYGIAINQPETYAERKALADDLISKTKLEMPVFIDDIDNQFAIKYNSKAYDAFLIDNKGLLYAKYENYRRKRIEIINDLKIISK